jgi:DNA-binding SARP family transcriptional activator
MLYLCLFGHLSVARCDGPAPGAAVGLSGRPAGLLAYLALAKGRFFSRSDLLSTLWSDPAQDGSSGSFNTTLWRLRKTLARAPLEHDEIVQCDRRGAVGLARDAPLKLDVDEFSELVNPGLNKALEQLDETDIENLRRGVRLYRDDILSGFSDDWALRARELHRRLQLNALARLMQLSALARDYASAIRYAQEILDHDALREDVHRELMRLFMLNGQRAMALRQFELCRAALRKELAIQPMAETLQAYQRIADGAVGRSAGPEPGVAPIAQTGRTWMRRAQDRMGVLSGVAGRPTPQELVSHARRYLAQADAHLQQSLPLFDGLVPRASP